METEAVDSAPWGGGVRPAMPGLEVPVCTLQVDSSGHQALQLHSGGVILFGIGVVGWYSSPASKGGPGGLRHGQLYKLLGA